MLAWLSLLASCPYSSFSSLVVGKADLDVHTPGITRTDSRAGSKDCSLASPASTSQAVLCIYLWALQPAEGSLRPCLCSARWNPWPDLNRKGSLACLTPRSTSPHNVC